MLKSLKSLFIIEEEEPKKEDPKAKKAPPASKSAPPPRSSGPSPGKVNDKILEKLMAVIEKNNLDGFDYIEYKRALAALNKMPMDEKTKYMSAFATATTVGATLQKLNSSIEHYKRVLKKENDEFLKTIDDQIHQKIGGRKQMVEDLKAKILDKSNMIKKLTEEIAEDQQKINENNTKIVEDQNKIDNTRLDFEKTFNQLMSQIDYDATRINDYLV